MKTETKKSNYTHLKTGKVGLIQETKDGRIIQVGLRPHQSEMLQKFLSIISQGEPLIQMGEEYELILKTKQL